MAGDLTIQFPIEPVLNAARLNAILRELKSALGPLGKEINEIDAEKLEKSLAEATDEAKKLSDETKKIGDNIKKASDQDIGGGFRKVMGDIGKFAGGTLLAGAVSTGFTALAGGIASVGKQMLQGASEMETYKTQLTSLLKSSDLAEQRLAELAKFGAETPFELTDLVKAEKVLIGFGLQGDKAMKLTGKSASELRTIIGDVAAGIGVPFDELSVTIGKFSTGATGEAISRLQELGIVTKEELSAAGIQFDKAGSLASSVPEALTAATAIMQQKFGGGMKALSQTAEGQISTLKDNLAQIFRDLGTPLFEALKPAIGQINELLGSDEIKNTITQLGTALGNIATTILPPLMQLVGSLLPLISSVLGAIIPILSSLFAAVIPVVQILAEQLAPVFVQIFTNLQPLVTVLLDIVGQILPLLLNALAPIWDLLPAIAQLLSDLLVPLLSALMPVLVPLIGMLGALIKIITPILGLIIEMYKTALKPFILATEIVGKLLGFIVGLFAELYKWIANGVNIVVNFLKQGLEPLNKMFEQVKKVIDDIIDGIRKFINSVGEILGLTGKEFKAPINPNYVDDMNKAADANDKFAQSGGNPPPPPPPPPPKKYKDITDEIVKMQREVARIERDEQTKRIEDDRLREKTALQNKLKDNIQAIEDEIAQVKKRDDISRKQKLELEKALNEKIKILTETNLLEQADIDKKYDEKALEEKKKTNEKMLALRKQMKDEEIKEIEELNKEELSKFEETQKAKQSLQTLLIKIGETAAQKSADEQFLAEQNRLEKQKELKLLSEVDFQKRKEQLEKDHQNRLAQIQATANGMRIEAERQQSLAMLQEKKKLLEAELAVDPNNETKIKQLEELNRSIVEKGDLLIANAQLLQEGVAEIFGNIFTGEDAMKDSARNLFATLAGILKKLATATITQIVLNQLGIVSTGTGLAALLFAPLIQGLVSAGVNAILDPIISSLTSFATGGRLDRPTLIVAGDASKARPGSDTEWIFRDDQIKAIIDGVMWKYLQLNVSMQEFQRMTMQDALLGLNDEIRSLSSMIKSGDLTVFNLKKLVEEIDNINQAEAKFYSGKITGEELAELISRSHTNIRSFAQGGMLSSPELILAGDAGSANPELILTLPMLKNIIEETSNLTSKAIENKLDILIDKFDEFEGRIHILESDVGRAANNYNYRQKKRNVIK